MKTTRTVKNGTHYRLIKTGKQFWIKVKNPIKSMPVARHISAKDARYLLSCGKSFDAACVWDFGLGIWQRVTRVTHHTFK